jgi:hypothetical protein
VESARAAAGFADQRLAAFDASIRAMSAVLSVDRILQVIVDRVRELVGASYAALGIVDAEGVIEEFITGGMSRLDRSRIGAPPRGHGILGLIIRENRSYRIALPGGEGRRVQRGRPAAGGALRRPRRDRDGECPPP